MRFVNGQYYVVWDPAVNYGTVFASCISDNKQCGFTAEIIKHYYGYRKNWGYN